VVASDLASSLAILRYAMLSFSMHSVSNANVCMLQSPHLPVVYGPLTFTAPVRLSFASFATCSLCSSGILALIRVGHGQVHGVQDGSQGRPVTPLPSHPRCHATGAEL